MEIIIIAVIVNIELKLITKLMDASDYNYLIVYNGYIIGTYRTDQYWISPPKYVLI